MSAVTFHTEDFRNALALLHAGLRNGAHQALTAALKGAADSARATTLFKDGPEAQLRKSIRTDTQGPLEGRLLAGGRSAPYAQFVESGTPPHEIHARAGGSLRFVMNGEEVFRRVVHHPGTSARPFMAEAAKVGEQTLDYGLELMTERPIAFFNSSG